LDDFDLNCDESRWIMDTNRDFGYESPSSLPRDGQSSREYDTDDLAPRPKQQHIHVIDFVSSSDGEDFTDSEDEDDIFNDMVS
jgi:hypothetical protein